MQMGLVELWVSFGIIWVGLGGVSSGYKFYVGGGDGWVVSPSEDYTHWSHRNRFQVNDTLYFRYKKGSDSVMMVKEEDYNTCNTTNPISSLNDGDSVVVLGRSGPFFFVSGNSGNCFRGQKLALVVMSAHHHRRHSPSPSPSPASVVLVPAISPSDSKVTAPAPISARNSGSVRPVVSSCFGLFVLVISSMV